jgi:hypothetical protein
MIKPDPRERVHLSLVHPWRQAVACYFAEDADLDELTWDFPPDYSAGDTVVHVVAARGLAILNVEAFATDSDAKS